MYSFSFDLETLLETSTASYGFVGATGNATSEQYFYPVISFWEQTMRRANPIYVVVFKYLLEDRKCAAGAKVFSPLLFLCYNKSL